MVFLHGKGSLCILSLLVTFWYSLPCPRHLVSILENLKALATSTNIYLPGILRKARVAGNNPLVAAFDYSNFLVGGLTLSSNLYGYMYRMECSLLNIHSKSQTPCFSNHSFILAYPMSLQQSKICEIKNTSPIVLAPYPPIIPSQKTQQLCSRPPVGTIPLFFALSSPPSDLSSDRKTERCHCRPKYKSFVHSRSAFPSLARSTIDCFPGRKIAQVAGGANTKRRDEIRISTRLRVLHPIASPSLSSPWSYSCSAITLALTTSLEREKMTHSRCRRSLDEARDYALRGCDVLTSTILPRPLGCPNKKHNLLHSLFHRRPTRSHNPLHVVTQKKKEGAKKEDEYESPVSIQVYRKTVQEKRGEYGDGEYRYDGRGIRNEKWRVRNRDPMREEEYASLSTRTASSETLRREMGGCESVAPPPLPPPTLPLTDRPLPPPSTPHPPISEHEIEKRYGTVFDERIDYAAVQNEATQRANTSFFRVRGREGGLGDGGGWGYHFSPKVPVRKPVPPPADPPAEPRAEPPAEPPAYGIDDSSRGRDRSPGTKGGGAAEGLDMERESPYPPRPPSSSQRRPTPAPKALQVSEPHIGNQDPSLNQQLSNSEAHQIYKNRTRLRNLAATFVLTDQEFQCSLSRKGVGSKFPFPHPTRSVAPAGEVSREGEVRKIPDLILTSPTTVASSSGRETLGTMPDFSATNSEYGVKELSFSFCECEDVVPAPVTELPAERPECYELEGSIPVCESEMAEVNQRQESSGSMSSGWCSSISLPTCAPTPRTSVAFTTPLPAVTDTSETPAVAMIDLLSHIQAETKQRNEAGDEDREGAEEMREAWRWNLVYPSLSPPFLPPAHPPPPPSPPPPSSPPSSSSTTSPLPSIAHATGSILSPILRAGDLTYRTPIRKRDFTKLTVRTREWENFPGSWIYRFVSDLEW